VNHRDHTRICVIDAEEASRIRSGVAWQKLRDALRHQRPLCALCNRWTEHIHHIVPLVEAPELAYTPSNLAPLCRLCHGRVEAMTTAGRRAEVAALLKGKEFRAVIGIG
jgi:5-methylcytosine-specific restriction endonuclease McrA